ncbi:MAG: HXXEE domain-containing protein [Solirubrobacterales bacterium]
MRRIDAANAGLRFAKAARGRTYNPGSLTAAALFLPLGIAGMRQLRRQGREGRGREVAVGAALGAASAAALMAVMRRRMRG